MKVNKMADITKTTLNYELNEDNCFAHIDIPELLGTQLLICLLPQWIHHAHWDE